MSQSFQEHLKILVARHKELKVVLERETNKFDHKSIFQNIQ